MNDLAVARRIMGGGGTATSALASGGFPAPLQANTENGHLQVYHHQHQQQDMLTRLLETFTTTLQQDNLKIFSLGLDHGLVVEL